MIVNWFMFFVLSSSVSSTCSFMSSSRTDSELRTSFSKHQSDFINSHRFLLSVLHDFGHRGSKQRIRATISTFSLTLRSSDDLPSSEPQGRKLSRLESFFVRGEISCRVFQSALKVHAGLERDRKFSLNLQDPLKERSFPEKDYLWKTKSVLLSSSVFLSSRVFLWFFYF